MAISMPTWRRRMLWKYNSSLFFLFFYSLFINNKKLINSQTCALNLYQYNLTFTFIACMELSSSSITEAGKSV